jgi:hypothetical protein
MLGYADTCHSCSECNNSCICSVQKPTNSVPMFKVERILTGLAAGLGFGIPASLMQVRYSGLRGLQEQG